jgi:hypothetical protein
MDRALYSPELDAAVKDARRFVDMDKTSVLIVEETVVAG